MAKDLNQCNFIGRLGQDPEVRNTQGGTTIANISIACSDDYKDKQTGEMVKKTDWIRITFFGRQAEVVSKYLSKGSRIYVSGKQVTRKWQNQEGQDRYSTEIHAREMLMLDTKGSGRSESQDTGYDDSNTNQDTGGGGGKDYVEDDFDSDIPF